MSLECRCLVFYADESVKPDGSISACWEVNHEILNKRLKLGVMYGSTGQVGFGYNVIRKKSGF